MPTTSTTTSVWRSGGGDSTKTSYAGSMLMVADFYIDPTDADTTAVQKSSTDTAAVILPIGAVVVEIQANAAGTGGTTPTFDMGWIGYTDTSATDPNGLLAAADADAGKQAWTWAAAEAGDDLGVVMSSTQMVKITGGATTGDAATGGTITGRIIYYVPTDGAYTA
jgi:hypothetical protein